MVVAVVMTLTVGSVSAVMAIEVAFDGAIVAVVGINDGGSDDDVVIVGGSKVEDASDAADDGKTFRKKSKTNKLTTTIDINKHIMRFES
jgi:hypothetical protein